ncbi:sulfurase, partial [Paracoccaceae bacterium]|nr:sulfurase [Paracoccaceae bacterium]
MSCLVKTDFKGTIAWLGRVSTPENNIRSESLTSAEASFEGIIGEAHSGATRPSCVRVTMLYPKGTEIR